MMKRKNAARGVSVALLLAALLMLSLAVRTGFAQTPAGSSTAQTRPAVMKIEQRTLANGLKLLMVEDHKVPIVNVQVWYHVGSKDEKTGRTGFAHLFEHMMFKGSAHVEPEEHSRIVEAAGGFDNAYTNDDVTVYWETVPSNFLERILWLEADRMGSLRIDNTNFQSEREVVKEERRLRIEDPPYGRVFEDLAAAAYTVHPYKHTTIGSMEDLNNATVDDVREFHRTFYRPDNATLVIVGDFDPRQAVAWTEKFFGGIPKPTTPLPRVTVVEPPQTAERRINKHYGTKSPLPAYVAGYRMPAQFTPDSYALILASNILSGGESSRLYRKLVYEDQVAVQAIGFGNFTEHPGLFLAIAVVSPGKSLSDAEKALSAALEEMKTTPVDAKELEKAKNQVLSNYILGRRTVQEKASEVGRAAVIGGNSAIVNTAIDNFLKVTPQDIQRVAQKYFNDSQRTVLVIEPPKSGD